MHLRFLGFVLIAGLFSACNYAPQAPTPMILPTFVQLPTSEPVIITATPQAIAQQATETATATLATVTSTNTQIPTQSITVTSTHVIPDVAQTLPTNTIFPTATITNTPTLQAIQATDLPPMTAFPDIETRYSDIQFNEALELINETPRVVMPVEHVRLIYERGRLRGLQDDFLLSVGDCNSESGWYLETLLDDRPPESGVDASYYESEQIQSTIDYFSDAFAYKGQSVNSGLNAASVLDPFWANADVCEFGESPLTCDYQRTHSFASLIMFGANDVNVLNTAGYEAAMRDIIETTLERDVIPILSTFSVRPIDGTNTYVTGVRFNAVLVQLAEEYQIPLVNFWLATRGLADNGILEDNAHLTVTGFNIRNQLTIEVLTLIRDEIMNEVRHS